MFMRALSLLIRNIRNADGRDGARRHRACARTDEPSYSGYKPPGKAKLRAIAVEAELTAQNGDPTESTIPTIGGINIPEPSSSAS
jgi:hypothetical protein